MVRVIVAGMVVLLTLLLVSAVTAETVKLQLSGPGKINDSTIKAGEKVSLDVYLNNEKSRMGFTIGFKIWSPDKSIANIIHPADSGKGLEDSKGDIKGYSGFEAKSIFDLVNRPVFTGAGWDGKLPDQIGFLAMVMKKRWEPMQMQKCYSIDLIVPTEGTIKIDSAFFPPGGRWIFVSQEKEPPTVPVWKGPYTFKVVK